MWMCLKRAIERLQSNSLHVNVDSSLSVAKIWDISWATDFRISGVVLSFKTYRLSKRFRVKRITKLLPLLQTSEPESCFQCMAVRLITKALLCLFVRSSYIVFLNTIPTASLFCFNSETAIFKSASRTRVFRPVLPTKNTEKREGYRFENNLSKHERQIR